MSVQSKAMREVFEREAAEGVGSFDRLADVLSTALDDRIRYLIDWHDLKFRPISVDDPRCPLAEKPVLVLEQAAEQKLLEARALAFAREFFRAMRDREGELRNEAFGRG